MRPESSGVDSGVPETTRAQHETALIAYLTARSEHHNGRPSSDTPAVTSANTNTDTPGPVSSRPRARGSSGSGGRCRSWGRVR
jgi:hypothetical protein